MTGACARTAAPPAATPSSGAPKGPASLGVASKAPPLTLVPAAVSRPALVASFLVPSLDRSVESAVALIRQASPLPLDAAGVRDLLLTQLGLPPDISKHVDLAAPVAGVAVAGKPGTSPLVAFSVAVRSATDVTALMSAAGQIIEQRGNAVQIQAPTGERGWFLTAGNVVVVADSEEALVMGGQLAIEGRAGGKDDASVLLFPDAMARATGTTVRAELDRVLARLDTPAAGEGKHRGAADRSRRLREISDYLADAASAELALDVDPVRGLGVAVRLSPRTGTKLETLAGEARTTPLDPLLGDGAGNAALVFMSAYGSRNLEALRRGRAEVLGSGSPELVGGPGATGTNPDPGKEAGKNAVKNAGKSEGRAGGSASRFLDALIAGLSGDLSAIVRVSPLFSADAVYPIKDAEAARTIQAALASVDRAGVTALLRSVEERDTVELKVTSVRTESFGKVRGLHVAGTWQAPAGGARRVLDRLVGHKPFDAFVAVVTGSRLAMTFGPGGRARITVMAAGTPEARSPALVSALAGSGARSIFVAADLREGIRFGLGLGEDPRARAIGDSLSAPMPIVAGVAGDAARKQLTVDFLLPPACFAGMGGLLQAAFTLRGN